MQNRKIPDFPRISRTLDEIRADLFIRLDAVQLVYAEKGWLPARLNLNKGVIRGLIELFAWGQFQLYSLMERVLRQSAPYYSSGKWLDLHAGSVELQRRPATRATGLVRFCRTNEGDTSNIPVKAGRIVRTLPDGAGEVYRYVTTVDVVLTSGLPWVAVPVESETYGSTGNAGTGQICELATPVTGVSFVTNAADWLVSEGADVETDAQLAERYRLQWAANNGCTKYAYMAWALSVPGVSSVAILDQHPRGQGTVDVVVRGAAVLPTEALLERVREAIAPHTPINDDWLVKGPIPVPVRIVGELTYTSGDPERLAATATDRLRSLFADKSLYPDITPLHIGQDVTLSLLTHVVMGISGVKSVHWGMLASPRMDTPSEWVKDHPVPRDGMAVLESLNLTAVMAPEA